jgi:hypothetical protein
MDYRATRYIHIEIFTGPAGLVPAGTTLAAFGTKFPRDAEVDQRINGRISSQENAATMTAITAVRSAPLDKFFTTKAQTTMTTVARLHANCRFVDEFHWLILRKTPPEAGFVSKEMWERL